MENCKEDKNFTMPKKKLGRTDLLVSRIGLGGMGFMLAGKKEKIKRAYDVINTALDMGVNFIDTARSYFDSEKIIGDVLKDRRDETYIATKTYMRRSKGAEKEIEESFKALRVKKIDLYQCHHVQYWDEFEKITSKGGALEVLKSYQREGLIDFIGISSHNPEILPRILESDLFDTVQFPFSVVEREHYQRIKDIVKKRNIGTIVMKPLAGGNIKSVETALKFLLSFDVDTIIPGCSTVDHVKLDVSVAYNFKGITEEEREKILKEVENLPDKFCRRCRYCEKVCPKNIPISDIFRCENYLILNATYARDEYRSLPHHATECIECGKCEEICPYDIPIRERLKKAHIRLTRGKLEDLVVKISRRLGIYDFMRMLYFKLGGKIPKR